MMPNPGGSGSVKEPQAKNTWAILSSLGSELEHTTRAMQGADPQFAQRLFVRTMFSVFDAYASLLADLALASAAAKGIALSKKTMERLQEGREEDQPDGSTKWKPRFVSTKARLLAAVNSYATTRDADSPLSGGQVPADFEIAAGVRNRITHPRSVGDFSVQKPEAEAIGRTMVWFKELVEWARGAELAYIEGIKNSISKSISAQIAKIRGDSRGHPGEIEPVDE